MAGQASDVRSLSFEEALKELEALSQKLSQGGLPLEESVEAYARGSELRKHCNDLLKRAEDRVKELDKKFGNDSEENEDASDGYFFEDEDLPGTGKRTSKKSRKQNIEDEIPF